ncbi:MAG: hypothetical protein AAF799_14900 [Myxococcota bacterium]
MHSLFVVMLGVVLGALAAAPSTPAADPEAEIRKCQQGCTSIADESDRATCELNCRQATESKDRVHIIRWKEERQVGGPAPGQTEVAAPVTTVTEVTPRGATTRSNAPAKPVASQPKPPPLTARQKFYRAVCGCQDSCNGRSTDIDRARCKLTCVRRRPGPPPPRTSPVGKAAPAAAPTPAVAQPQPVAAPAAVSTPAVPTVDCTQQCAGEPTDDDRMTCAQMCEHEQDRKVRAAEQEKNTRAKGPAAEQCRMQCRADNGPCRAGCSGQGSNTETCRQQCDQAMRACAQRCG